MAINVIFNMTDYEISQRKMEQYDKYLKVIKWGRVHPVRFMEQIFGLQFTDHQRYVLMSTWNARYAVWLMSRNSGKAIDLDTEIPIYVENPQIDIKHTLRDLKVNDMIYDNTGELTQVTHLNPIIFDYVYEILFDDGEIIKCNQDHLWTIYDGNNNLSTVNTGYLYNNINKLDFYIPISKPIDYANKEILPITPYELGKILGKKKVTTIEENLLKQLKNLGIFSKRRIPSAYLYTSIENRLNLLYGIVRTTDDFVKDNKIKIFEKDSSIDFLNDISKLLSSLSITSKILNNDNFDECYIEFSFNKHKFNENKNSKKKIINITKTDIKKPMRCITVDNDSGLFLCGEKNTVTHNSYLSAPYIMARSILIPNHNSYIMCPSGNQAQITFSKIEDLATGKISSVKNSTSVFINELIAYNSAQNGFIHDKLSHHCQLFNGSGINTLNSIAKNVVGIRSNLNFYDEAGKVEREYFALTEPFGTQDRDFATGTNFNLQCMPKQMPNQFIYASSAEDMDSRLYDIYKESALRMIAGDRDYFCCDITCELSLHPKMNGKEYVPLLSQEVIDNALKMNEYRAHREYFNKFDISGGQDCLVKRLTILSNSYAYLPIFKNEGGKKYIIAYDPATKLDNSVVGVGELIDDPEDGYKLKLINFRNLIELLSDGNKKVIQKPEQVEIIKMMLLDYNGLAIDYDNIQRLIIDAGAGGGGFESAQYLLKDWHDGNNRRHLGLIDLNDKYLSVERDKFPGAVDKITMANFRADKVKMYQACQDMINQGHVMFPKALNIRGEMEYEEVDENGIVNIMTQPVGGPELASLIEFDLLKEELVSMQKYKQGGNVRFDLMPSKVSEGMHDDRADVCAMMCYELSKIRSESLLSVPQQSSGFDKIYKGGRRGPSYSPFGNSPNPFLDSAKNNPFNN